MTYTHSQAATRSISVPNANDNAGNTPSWAQQDGTLRDLWAQNLNPDQIADVLGRSTAAVMTRAARLGLPRRFAPGRKPLEQGVVRKAPAQRPARNFTKELFGEAAPHQSRAMRTCLMCINPFQSSGAHNRICPRCKGGADYEAGTRLADADFYF